MNLNTPTRNSTRLRLSKGLAFLLLTWSTAAPLAAQADAPQEDAVASTESENGEAARDRWSVSLGGGLLSTNDAPSGTFTFDHRLFGSEQGEFDVDYDLTSAVRFDQTYPFDTANYTGVEHRKESGSAIGYHLGIDVAYYFSKSTGLGGVVRFSDASIDLDAPSGGTVAIGGGGLQTAVDLRFRF